MPGKDFNLVLYQPVIPQNTGSIARLCACTGAALHLIHPLGFRTDDSSVKRAGLDYWPHVDITEHSSWEAFVEKVRPERLVFLSKKAGKNFFDAELAPPVYLVLGSETTGLPEALWERHREGFFKMPMRTEIVRSLNLSQTAAVAVYEAMRRSGWPLLPT